jgi:hypothetical protein
MTLALFVEPIRHPWRVLSVILITPRARRASATAVAGVLVFPRLMGMVLTHPTEVLAEGALHGLSQSPTIDHPNILSSATRDTKARQTTPIKAMTR